MFSKSVMGIALGFCLLHGQGGGLQVSVLNAHTRASPEMLDLRVLWSVYQVGFIQRISLRH